MQSGPHVRLVWRGLFVVAVDAAAVQERFADDTVADMVGGGAKKSCMSWVVLGSTVDRD